MSSVSVPTTTFRPSGHYLKRNLRQVVAALRTALRTSRSHAEKVSDRVALNRIARQYDELMPNLAAELRYLSSRG